MRTFISLVVVVVFCIIFLVDHTYYTLSALPSLVALIRC